MPIKDPVCVVPADLPTELHDAFYHGWNMFYDGHDGFANTFRYNSRRFLAWRKGYESAMLAEESFLNQSLKE